MRRTAGVAMIVGLLLIGEHARAQSSTGELRDAAHDHRVAGDLGFFYRTSGMSDVALFQPSIDGQFTLARSDEAFVQLDAAWRFIGSAGSISAFRAMNPYLGVRGGIERHAEELHWRARGGLGFTLPLTNVYDDFGGFLPPPAGTGGLDGALTQLFAPGMQGAFDLWLLTPLNAALVIRGDAEVRHPYFVAGGDVALTALLPVEYRGRTGDTLVAMQLGAFAGGRPIPELVLGLRFQAVAGISTRGGNVEGYTSLAPFVRGEFGAAFIEARLLVNLDTPYGFSFDSGAGSGSVPIWAVQVLGGASF